MGDPCQGLLAIFEQRAQDRDGQIKRHVCSVAEPAAGSRTPPAFGFLHPSSISGVDHGPGPGNPKPANLTRFYKEIEAPRPAGKGGPHVTTRAKPGQAGRESLAPPSRGDPAGQHGRPPLESDRPGPRSTWGVLSGGDANIVFTNTRPSATRSETIRQYPIDPGKARSNQLRLQQFTIEFRSSSRSGRTGEPQRGTHVTTVYTGNVCPLGRRFASTPP